MLTAFEEHSSQGAVREYPRSGRWHWVLVHDGESERGEIEGVCMFGAGTEGKACVR